MDIKKLQKQSGVRLRELRLAKGLKQEDLENYGFSYRHYGKLERGAVNPTLETLVRLSKIFKVSLPDLFAFMGENGPGSENGPIINSMIYETLSEDTELVLNCTEGTLNTGVEFRASMFISFS